MKLGAIVAIGISLSSASAFAAPGDYLKFLQSLEGDWQGQGEARDYTNGQTTSFDFSMSMYREGNTNTWLAQTSESTQSGQGNRDGITFQLAAQILEIDHDSITGGFSSVTDSTDHSIDYDVSETQGMDFIDHYYHWETSANGLSGSVRIEDNGMPIYEESFSASKSQRSVRH